MNIYFSDFFNCSSDDLEAYGALDVSLISDLPLFIDPFLLFNSRDADYQRLHENMIEYIRFLKQKADSGSLRSELVKSWYMFSEVKQNWLGYSIEGNSGRGLGRKFAESLHSNLNTVFKNFGQEQITKGKHIEKLCLIRSGVGRDNISDFCTNLIKHFLLEYTQAFTKKHIDPAFTKKLAVPRVRFNYNTETWETDSFVLPWFVNDFVLLTPENILTRDDTWISQRDLFRRYEYIAASVANAELRGQLDNYFKSVLPKKPEGKDHTQEEKNAAVQSVIERFPEIIDHYIRDREDHGDEAVRVSSKKVERTKEIFIEQVRRLSELLRAAGFYEVPADTYEAAMRRVEFMKQVVENNDGYRLFYGKDGAAIEREKDLELIYRLTWFASSFEVDFEVNNGRGPVDCKISNGSIDKSLVEFKLASNTKLEQNLANQVDVYKKANATKKAIKVIIYFTLEQLDRVRKILKTLRLENDTSIVLIDARRDNKTSASKVKSATRGKT
jgi:hypothetical protein